MPWPERAQRQERVRKAKDITISDDDQGRHRLPLLPSGLDTQMPEASPSVELEEPRGLAVGAGSALDEAELLVEVHVAARDEALGLEVV